MDVFRTKLRLLALVFVTVGFFWSPILWRGTAPFHEALFLLYQPNYAFFRDAIQAGILPLWNPYIYSGVPFVANLQSAVFYPFSYLYAVFPFVNALKINLVVHSLIAMTFMCLLMRSLGVGGISAWMGGIVFSFNGFLSTHFAFPSQFNAIVWIPAVIFFLNRYASEGRIPYLLYGAIVFSIQIFAGQPQFVLYMIIGILVLGIFSQQKARFFGGLGCMMAAGSLLSAIQILPSIPLILNSPRAQFGYPEATTFSLHPLEMLKMLAPAWSWYFSPKSGDPNIVTSYLGPFVLFMVLACIFFRMPRRKIVPWFVMMAVGILLSFGAHAPYYKIFYDIKLLSWFRYPPQAAVLISLGAAVLASFAFEKFNFSPRIAMLVIGLVFLDLWFFSFKSIKRIDADFYERTTPTILYLKADAGLGRVFVSGKTLGYDQWRGKTFLEAWLNFKNALIPNTPMTFGLYDASGAEVLRLKEYDAILDEVYRDPESPLIDLLGIRYFVSLFGSPSARYQPIEKGGLLYKNTLAFPKAYFSIQSRVSPESILERSVNISTVTVTEYAPNRVSVNVETKRDGWLIITDAYDPDWRAFTGGRAIPIERVNRFQRGVNLPVGNHLVQFVYRPLLFVMGGVISLLTFFILALLFFIQRKHFA